MIKKRASGHQRTYSNALRCRLSRLAMIKKRASGHRRTYSDTLRCRLSRLAMIKNSRWESVEPTTPVYRRIPPKGAEIQGGILCRDRGA